MIGGLAEPLRRTLVVRSLVAAVGIEHREIVHRLGVAALGRANVVAAGRVDILFAAEALFVQRAEPEHRRHDAAVRGAVVPFGGFIIIDRDTLAFGKAHADFVGGGRIALQGGGPQHHAADRVRQCVGDRRQRYGSVRRCGPARRSIGLRTRYRARDVR